MKLWLPLFTLAFCAPAPADILECKRLSLEAPAPWKKSIVDREESLVAPPGETPITKKRRIHFVIPEVQARTLQEALENEMDRIDRRGSTTAYGNGRDSFIAATPFKTKSGLQGLRATFGTKRNNGQIFYQINKYYLWDNDGTLCKVCAHVYGDQKTADQFDQLILESLKQTYRKEK